MSACDRSHTLSFCRNTHTQVRDLGKKHGALKEVFDRPPVNCVRQQGGWLPAGHSDQSAHRRHHQPHHMCSHCSGGEPPFAANSHASKRVWGGRLTPESQSHGEEEEEEEDLFDSIYYRGTQGACG